MKFRNIVASLLITGFCFLSFTCNSPTGPGASAQPGSRNYSWTTDTLSPSVMFGATGYNLTALSGSSPMDVWTGGTHITPQYNLFHYDGTKWTGWSIPGEIWTILSFAPNDVWEGGNDGKIWHFDGKTWSQNFAYTSINAAIVTIVNIYGLNPNDLYAVGAVLYDPGEIQRGFILHYDGKGWTEMYKANIQSQFIRIRVEETGSAYVYGVRDDWTSGGDTLLAETRLLYQFRNGILRQIDTDSAKQGSGFVMVDEIQGNAYFVLNHDICRYASNNYMSSGAPPLQGNFVKLFSIGYPQFDGQIYGRSENDLFLNDYDGIAHWNGTDIKRLLTFSNNFTFIPTPAIFDKEVFFCVFDGLNNVNMVVRGRLTN